MADQRERLGASGEANRKLLCFPLSLQVGRVQIPHIVNIAGLGHAEMLSYVQNFLKPQGDLLPIVMREIMNTANEAKEVGRASGRRGMPFYPSEFLHGVYAVSRILLAQAQENMDFAERGEYPHITADTYQAVRQQRSDRGEADVPFRERFRPEVERMEVEQPHLIQVLTVIALEGLELTENRNVDFFGGAAFAYQLFQHA